MMHEKEILLVGGRFDETGGRPSSYFRRMALAMLPTMQEIKRVKLVNGGTKASFEQAIQMIDTASVIVWAADVPNTWPKEVDKIKVRNPNAMLMITKNNRSGKYARTLLVARALSAKANLLMEFSQGVSDTIAATVLDPLGNTFGEQIDSPEEAGVIAGRRLSFLERMTRIGSRSIGDLPPFQVSHEHQLFFALVRSYADTFHQLIHHKDEETGHTRLLGNLSFRCASGFPGMRSGAWMLVSRRNVDKREVGVSAMVPVRLENDDRLLFLGEHKPSVDSPIQRALFMRWPKARFILHAHVYLKDAPFTETIIPCGAMEEVDEIMKVVPEHYDGTGLLLINLRGHGSIAVASEARLMENLPYERRTNTVVE